MKKVILVVDDNELNRELLKGTLEDEYEILEARHGQEALNILERDKEDISLILLDIVMPVMDGYEFLNSLNEDPELSLIPVIVTTQFQSEAEEITALKHGAIEFVPKPYRPQIIRHRIENLIKLRETAAIANQFKYDKLTGLYSKEYFYSVVRQCLDENPDKEYTILCCNLENFKLYNDSFGREAGDRLIIEEAKTFREHLAPWAICGRYNADRMLALVEKESEKIGREFYVNARKKKRSALSVNMGVKLGIYEITDRTIPVEQMCDWAIWVVDSIKGKYNQHYAVYDEALRKLLLHEQEITDAMGQALAEKQFAVYFQPKYSLANGGMIGAEALVRWKHPERGLISPGDFIPLFERNGFVKQLDKFVWERVCERLRAWKEKGYPQLPVSVNVSRSDMYQLHLVDTFCALTEKYGINPSMLHLEITESAYAESTEQIISVVQELRENGFIVEMDDFGSGYSSLSLLGQMKLDVLKLDMAFVHNELGGPKEESLLGDVISMAHRKRLTVVAEGVETDEQHESLREMDCDFAQGNFFAAPMHEDEFERVLQACAMHV